jgi:hypothetical protein
MRSRTLWVFAAAACLGACGKQPPAEDAAVEAPADEPVVVEQATAADEAVPAELVFDQAFIDHMHVHAERVDELMFALEDGDLDAARSPAAWLSRHQPEDRIPDEWLPYLEAMQKSARAVENATKLETARAAAEQISVYCQECHTAAGINTAE